MQGIQQLVDKIGGIEVTVEKDMNYIDQAGDLYIDIKKVKLLNGEQIVQYLRFRYDDEGDIGRIRRRKILYLPLLNLLNLLIY